MQKQQQTTYLHGHFAAMAETPEEEENVQAPMFS